MYLEGNVEHVDWTRLLGLLPAYPGKDPVAKARIDALEQLLVHIGWLLEQRVWDLSETRRHVRELGSWELQCRVIPG